MTSTNESARSGSLENKKFLITSGPMRAPIDAIRYIANTSSGRLGSLLAIEALTRGARVTFVYGQGSVRPEPENLGAEYAGRFVAKSIITYDDLMKILSQELAGGKYDVVLHAMAVLDYVPEVRSTEKTPSGKDHWTIKLLPTPKLIQMIKRWDPRVLLVGFKLEVGVGQEKLIEAARRSAQKNRADLVVANELSMTQGQEHQALVVDLRGAVVASFRGKEQIARGLMDIIAAELKGDR